MKPAFVAILFIVLAAALFLWGRGGEPAEIRSPEEPLGDPAAIVRMTGNGFSPTTTAIHIGGIVEFRNDSGKGKWPASDLHPTHELYSAFDPQRPIEPGSSWKFRFEREGEWKFHDHLFPAHRGTINVSDPANAS